jgi:hypothetical protein
MPNLQPYRCSNVLPRVSQQPQIHIQSFDGEPSSLKYFIDQLKDISRISQWPDEFLLAYARSKLTGNAQKLIQQAHEINSITTSADLFSKLQDFFDNKSTASHTLELHSFHMLPGETIKNLAHRLDILTHNVYTNIKDKAALDEIKYVKFTQVLPPDIRLLILQNNITTYDEAVKRATLAQDCFINNKVLSSINVPESTESEHIVNALTNKVDNLTKDLAALQNKNSGSNNKHNFRRFQHKKSHNTNSWRQRRMFDNKFNQYKAHGKFRGMGNHRRGHFTSHVHTPPIHDAQYTPPIQATQYNDMPELSLVTCQICNKRGHTALKCYQAVNFFKQGFQALDNSSNAIVPYNNTTVDPNAMQR